MSNLSKILTNNVLTVILDGSPYTIAKSHERFQSLLDAVNAQDEAKVRKIINVIESLREYVKTSSGVTISGGTVYYNGECVENAITDRIISAMDSGIMFDDLVRFLDNLMSNPSYQSRQELYMFLENCRLPITSDGRFIAYKAVRSDMKDKFSGTFDNSPGQVVTMPRARVNDDRQKTCSAGLHVMSLGYMGQCGFGRGDDVVVAVAINPAHVVSVPYDYNNAKMRVCEYEVLQVVENPHEAFATSVVDTDDIGSYFEDDDDLFDFDDEDDDDDFFL